MMIKKKQRTAVTFDMTEEDIRKALIEYAEDHCPGDMFWGGEDDPEISVHIVSSNEVKGKRKFAASVTFVSQEDTEDKGIEVGYHRQ